MKQYNPESGSLRKVIGQCLMLGLILIISGCTPAGDRALLEGKVHLDKGDFQKAITSFKKATNLKPDSARAWNYLGIAYHHDRQYIAARDAYDKSLSRDKNLAQVPFNKGRLMLETGQNGLAISLFKTYQMLKPQSTDALPLMALAYYGEGELETAKGIYEDLLRKNENNPSAWNGIGLILVQQRQFREAYNFFSTALKHKNDFAPALFNQGVIAYPSLQRPDLAVKKLREFIWRDSNSPLAPKAKAMANALENKLLQKGDITKSADSNQVQTAETNSQTISEPEKSETTNLEEPKETVEQNRPRQEIVQDTQQPKSTTNLVTKAESKPDRDEQENSIPPEQPAATTEEIKVADKESEEPKNQSPVVETIEPIQKEIIAPSTNQTNVVVNQAFITGPDEDKTTDIKSPPIASYSTNGDGEDQTNASSAVLIRSNQPGVTPLPQGMPTNPYKYLLPGAPLPGNRNQAASWLEKGNRAFNRNDFAEAIEAYEKAVMEDPSYFDAYANLGLAALKGGSPSKALPAYEYALAIRPDHRDSRYNFSLGLEKLNHFRDAARELESLLDEYPNDTQILMRLGELYSGPLQRPVRTREIYREVLKASPGSPEARAAQSWLYDNP